MPIYLVFSLFSCSHLYMLYRLRIAFNDIPFGFAHHHNIIGIRSTQLTYVIFRSSCAPLNIFSTSILNNNNRVRRNEPAENFHRRQWQNPTNSIVACHKLICIPFFLIHKTNKLFFISVINRTYCSTTRIVIPCLWTIKNLNGFYYY